jgi:hypothetical protein
MPYSPDMAALAKRRSSAELSRLTLMALFARLDTVAMTVAMGVVFGLGLFAMTAILLLKGAAPGYPVGPNLVALSTFLPGYSVTWLGSLVGIGYGFLIGSVVGFVVAVLWNFTHLLFIGFAVSRGSWLD